MIDYVMRQKEPVQPKTVAPCFKTAGNNRVAAKRRGRVRLLNQTNADSGIVPRVKLFETLYKLITRKYIMNFTL